MKVLLRGFIPGLKVGTTLYSTAKYIYSAVNDFQ